MTGPSSFTQLRNLLAELYPDRADLRRLLADAGINATRVELDSTAINNWHALLAEAEKAKKIDALLAVVQSEYGENADLQAAIAAYRQTVSASVTRVQDSQVEPAPAPATAPVAPGQPIDIFLSYSRHDTATRQQLQAELTAVGFTVWIDDLDLEPGTPSWQRAVETAINAACTMVVILSPAAKNSVWVGRELSYAETLGLPIIPGADCGGCRQRGADQLDQPPACGSARGLARGCRSGWCQRCGGRWGVLHPQKLHLSPTLPRLGRGLCVGSRTVLFYRSNNPPNHKGRNKRRINQHPPTKSPLQ